MVEQPTVIFGKTQSGKTYRAFHLWNLHPGPAIFCDIQWRNYLPGTHYARSIEDVVAILNASPGNGFDTGPKICWRLDNYAELGDLVDYLLRVHRGRHDQGVDLPTLALFLDEAWRVADRGADAENPAVRVFTEGFQHRVIGVALSQWVSQVAHLIPGNAYEFYIFDLWERDLELLRTLYRMEVPSPEWLRNYQYYRYDGAWWKGNAEGVEISESAVPELSENDKGNRADADTLPERHERNEATVGTSRSNVPELRGFDEAGGSNDGIDTSRSRIKGFNND